MSRKTLVVLTSLILLTFAAPVLAAAAFGGKDHEHRKHSYRVRGEDGKSRIVVRGDDYGFAWDEDELEDMLEGIELRLGDMDLEIEEAVREAMHALEGLNFNMDGRYRFHRDASDVDWDELEEHWEDWGEAFGENMEDLGERISEQIERALEDRDWDRHRVRIRDHHDDDLERENDELRRELRELRRELRELRRGDDSDG